MSTLELGLQFRINLKTILQVVFFGSISVNKILLKRNGGLKFKCHDTSHSAYAATETELVVAKIEDYKESYGGFKK